ncbi:MAG: sensor histidine kinase [Phycisphaerales bacterium JB052]
MPETIAQIDPMTEMAKATSATLSPGDLAELMAAFTEVTTKLERTHEQLRSEVSRLNAELRDANEALQRSRRLAALGEMAAGISHEIRNPLGSIQLYTNMLRDDLAQMPEQHEIVSKIGRAVRGLDEIVGDVLSFAREIHAKPRPCDLEAVLAQAVELCCADIAGSVRLDIDPQHSEIECDAALLQQALVNLLRNAGEANRLSGGSEIVIETTPTRVERDDRAEPAVAIAVHDRGDGIPEQVIERMFNPFFTTRAAGTGLGLAIVHRIVDAHRGLVEVGNHTDEPGAWVRLVLPMAQPVVVVKSEVQSVADLREHVPQAGASPIAMR